MLIVGIIREAIRFVAWADEARRWYPRSFNFRGMGSWSSPVVSAKRSAKRYVSWYGLVKDASDNTSPSNTCHLKLTFRLGRTSLVDIVLPLVSLFSTATIATYFQQLQLLPRTKRLLFEYRPFNMPNYTVLYHGTLFLVSSTKQITALLSKPTVRVQCCSQRQP